MFLLLKLISKSLSPTNGIYTASMNCKQGGMLKNKTKYHTTDRCWHKMTFDLHSNVYIS